jgi:hypothetical protein
VTQLAIDRTSRDLERPLRIVSGIEEIAQDLWLRTQTFLGEIVYDTTIGVPIAQEIVRKGTPPSRIAAIYRRIILETPGVRGFLPMDNSDELGPVLTLDPQNRGVTILYRVDTDEGELTMSGPVYLGPLPEDA